MKVVAVLTVIVAGALAYGAGSVAHGQAKQEEAPSRALAGRYCASCHNDKIAAGGFSFQQFDWASPSRNAELSEKIILKVRTGLMPPSGHARPDAAALKAFAADLEARVDADSDLDPGRPLLHRLNRAEYRNAVRDLLDVDIDVEGLLPPDNVTQGFDNMSEALTVTPTLMDAYVAAAGKIARLAVGDPAASPTVAMFRLPTNVSQTRYVEGAPLGTRGGIAVRHVFPADAEYTFKASLVFTRNTFLFGSTITGEQLEIAVDGERVALFTINPLMKGSENNFETPPVKVTAGPHTVSAAFVVRSEGPIDDFLRRPERSLGDDFVGQTPGLTGLPHLREFGIVGPHKVTGVSDTPSRRRVFVCHPASPGEERICATNILSALASRAFRGTDTRASLQELLGAFDDGRARGGFETGIRLAIQLLLVHPEFVYRVERTPAGSARSGVVRLGDAELASRLSFFLWSSIPDDELLAVARQGKLRDPETLRRQVRRMLADSRSRALAQNFANHWLRLRSLDQLNPDVYLYPDSDDNLFASMKRETELLFESIVRENRDVVELLRTDYTFVDERLARHYGIPNVVGPRFRRVTLVDPNRFGLLGQGSVLSLTSTPNRTSPVARGKYVLEQILGVSPPPPPPVVPQLEENNVIGGEPLKLRSVRERLEEHRTVEPCRSCHQIIDPLGLALENFDAIGVWRQQDSGHPVEASGALADGTPLDGPVALRDALIAYSDAYVTNLTAKLLAYGLGRVTSARDMPYVRKILKHAGTDRRFESIVYGIVTSEPFQMVRADAAARTSTR